MKRLFFWSALVVAIAVVRSVIVRPRLRYEPVPLRTSAPEPATALELPTFLPPTPKVAEPDPSPEPVAPIHEEMLVAPPAVAALKPPRRWRSRVLAFAVGAFAGLTVGAIVMGSYWLTTHDGPTDPSAATVVDVPLRFDPEPLFALVTVDVTIAPAEGTAVLGSLEEGAQVDVFVIDGAWAAVRYPAGSSSWGWAPVAALARAPAGSIAASASASARATGEVQAKTTAIAPKAVVVPHGTFGPNDVAWMALLVALGMTLIPAGLAWRMDK